MDSRHLRFRDLIRGGTGVSAAAAAVGFSEAEADDAILLWSEDRRADDLAVAEGAAQSFQLALSAAEEIAEDPGAEAQVRLSAASLLLNFSIKAISGKRDRTRKQREKTSGGAGCLWDFSEKDDTPSSG